MKACIEPSMDDQILNFEKCCRKLYKECYRAFIRDIRSKGHRPHGCDLVFKEKEVCIPDEKSGECFIFVYDTYVC